MPPTQAARDSQLRLFEETLDAARATSAPRHRSFSCSRTCTGPTDRRWISWPSSRTRLATQRMLVVATYRSDRDRAGEAPCDASSPSSCGAGGRCSGAGAARTVERRELARLLVSGRRGAAARRRPRSRSASARREIPSSPRSSSRPPDGGEETLPRVLRDVLLQRFAGLDGETQSLLRVAAAAGRDVPYRLLAAVVPSRRGAARRGAAPGGRARRARGRPAGGHVPVPACAAGRGDLHHRPAGRARGDPRAPRQRPRRRSCASLRARSPASWRTTGRRPGGRSRRSERRSTRPGRRGSVGPGQRRSGTSSACSSSGRRSTTPRRWSDSSSGRSVAWAAEVAFFAGAAGRAAELIRRAIALTGARPTPCSWACCTSGSATFLLPGRRTRARRWRRTNGRSSSSRRSRRRRSERVVLAAYGHALMLAWRSTSRELRVEEALAVAAAIGDERPALRARAVLGIEPLPARLGARGAACLHDARQRAREHGVGPRRAPRPTFCSRTCCSCRDGWPRRLEEALEGLASLAGTGTSGVAASSLAANAAEALLGSATGHAPKKCSSRPSLCTGGFRPEGVHIVCAQLALGRGQLEIGAASTSNSAPRAGDRAAVEGCLRCLSAELALWEGRFDDAVERVDRALRNGRTGDLQIREHGSAPSAFAAEAERVADAAVRRETAAVDAARRHADELLERARRSASRTLPP